MVKNTGYQINTYNKHLWIENDLISARWRAFEILMKNKKTELFIKNHYTGEDVGAVYFSHKKTKNGTEYGPTWYSFRTRKEYLLDYDGSIFSVKTERRMPGQYARKRR